jgi:hypothetical protein
MKRFAALPEAKLFVIVTNTNLGMSNARQNLALASDLAWIKQQGGHVYLIGHHPATIGCVSEHGLHDCGGDRFIPAQFRGEKTVFLSHLYIKAIFLPRQARDKHRENSKTGRFLRVGPRNLRGAHPLQREDEHEQLVHAGWVC